MRRRLLIGYLTVTLLVLLMLEIPLGFTFSEREKERLTADAERDAMVLATLYEDALDLGHPFTPLPAIEYSQRTGARVVVVDKTGLSFVDTADDPVRDFSTRPEIQVALAGRRDVGVRASETLGTHILYIAVPVASGGRILGAVRLTRPVEEVNARIHRFWWGLAGIGLVVLAAMAGIGWVIATSVTRPLSDLEKASARMAAGDLDVRIAPGDAPPELRKVVEAFNHMADRVRDTLQRHRAFIGNASHQLRTPLTALRLRLENLETGPDTSTDLQAAIDETTRLGTMVDQLLELARLGEGTSTEIVDVRRLAEERREVWEAVAREQEVTLELVAPDRPVWVEAVGGAVPQILDNYLANALRVSPSGGRLVIAVVAGTSLHEVHVVDEGPGMDPDARHRAFDRFWRDGENRGSGLGLAIVRTLAELSGGHAELREASTGGVDAVVVFRAAHTQTARPVAEEPARA